MNKLTKEQEERITSIFFYQILSLKTIGIDVPEAWYINAENELKQHLADEIALAVKERDDELAELFDKLRFSPKGCDESYWYTRGDDVLKSQVYWEAIRDCIKLLKQKEL